MLSSARDPIYIAAPLIGAEEEEAVLRVLRSGRLAQGPEVEALEMEFASASSIEHAVAVNNGTSSLIAALHCAGVGEDDEVIVPAFTFAATANAVMAVGARPVFVDIGDDYLIDVAAAEASIGERTAAIMPVHLYGLMADMTAIEALAAPRDLAIIEDAAQAHLATRDGRPAGSIGIGSFSLYATKNMTTGEGGIVTTADATMAEKLRLFRNHGMPRRYHHAEWGLNLRMTDLQAAIGRAQLAKLEKATRVRNTNADRLDEILPEEMQRPPRIEGARHVFHQYTVAVPADQRAMIVDRFREAGIGVEVYYPEPIHQQPAFAEFADPDACPRATLAAETVVSLPVHPRVTEDDLEYIAEIAAKAVLP